MTDNEIIKALKMWLRKGDCNGECPLLEMGYCFDCACVPPEIVSAILLSLTAKKTENENLKVELKAMRGAANSYKLDNERLKAENKSIRYCYEQAKSYNDTLAESCEKNCKHFNMTTRAEAIKDFAERLKSKVNDLEFRTKTNRKTVPTKFCDDNANWVMHECVPEEIDKLVKEMTGGE